MGVGSLKRTLLESEDNLEFNCAKFHKPINQGLKKIHLVGRQLSPSLGASLSPTLKDSSPALKT